MRACPTSSTRSAPYLAPAVLKTEVGAPEGGTLFGFGPTYTVFLTAKLTRTPTQADRLVLEKALAKLEATFPFAANGLFTHIAYGLPVLRPAARRPERARWWPARCPGSRATPPGRCSRRPCPARPTCTRATPAIAKPRFNVPVRIEDNDVLITLRSDSKAILDDVQNWLWGRALAQGRQGRGAGVQRPVHLDLVAG